MLLSIFLSLACSPTEEADDERPDESVTVYADGLELFMEYPAFVVGEDSPLVAHFTDARDPDGFVWVTEGKVTATLKYADGAEETFSIDHLLRNGIFKPVVRPTKEGKATLTLRLEGPVSGTVSVGEVTVYDSISAAVAAAPEEVAGEPTVPYLKESQWKTVYATALAERRTLRAAFPAPAEITAPTGKLVEIASPFSGRIATETPPRIGQAVTAGEQLGTVIPLGQDRGEADVARARAEADLALAEAAAERARRLFPGSISQRQLDAAESDVIVARRALDAARGRQGGWRATGGAGFDLRSPIDGVVAFTEVLPGRVISEGTPLLTVVDASRLWAVAHVFESDAARIFATPGLELEVSGHEFPLVLDTSHGAEVVSVGSAIDPRTRTVPVIVAFDNPGNLMPGMFAQARVYTAESRDAIAIPVRAVVDDGGFPTVFVMEDGESFFKRRVVTGARDGDWIEVVSGVSDGERVVSRGTWEVKLATMPGAIPAHGHQH
jgi:cobalt-zinc-cadmium efflux system membrane fusion protein